MRQLLAGFANTSVVLVALLLAANLAPAAAGPHGCYSSHCGKR